eukprot:CAMPEP_0202444922 /NCGR_PEP_ID=MMETSP1360-20130828/3835_1 /ASSEMBLY_ACC=CAM_ASM_000848 /TAXON_ID=515479 /ORGANISM="Licmophora paradoxa, Strain CCMP2313" /LENGTH=330 /DNA_ID=CAMNT_0049061023 /DNA_START=254 /DNA_END=1246 /DNA_ORIENTATION=-
MKRDDPVVKISQMPFMLLICIGAIISSSSIVALTLAEADDGEDTTSANFACQSIPFLYTIGWALQYSSLFAKSYRIYKLTNVQRFQRVTITTKAMMKLIAIFMLADLTVVFIWTFVDPLTYEREVIGRNVDSENGLITVSTVGRCTNGPPTDFWPYIGPLAFFHILLMVVTNFLLWMTRKIVDDRYQEQKYVALASLYVGEILLVGLPVLLAVGESVVAQYIVLSCLVFLNDSGILAFVFFPKMNFVKEGLPEGVSVTQSVQRSTLNSSIKFNMQGSFTEGRISTHSVTATNPQDESHPEITLPTHHEDEENSSEISSSTKQRSKQGRLG